MAEIHFDVGAYNRFINRVVQPYLRKKADEIAEEVRRNAPVGATQELRSSVRVTEGTKGSVRITVGAEHAGYVSQGTGPQATSPRPPYYPRLRRRGLILWSESKAVSPYAVAHGISQKGTPPNPFFENSIAHVLSRFDFRWIRRDIQT